MVKDLEVENSSPYSVNVHSSGTTLIGSRIDVEKVDVDVDVTKDVPITGTRDAWMTVAGSWFILFASLGYLYSFGVYQDFYTRIYLTNHTPSTIFWLGSMQLALPFTMGVLSGKIFDAGHARILFTIGSVLFSVTLFMLSLTQQGQFYQESLGMGLGVGLLFAPATAIVSVHFANRPWRLFAIGTALSGSSFGALVFPIMFNNLLPHLGFAATVRATGYLVIACLIVGNCLIRVIKREKAPVPDVLSFFKDPAYVCYLVGSSMALLGGYFPVLFMQLFAIEKGIDPTLAFYTVAILNGLGVPARVVGSYLAEKIGIWNTITGACFIGGCVAWSMLAVNGTNPLIAVCVLYGICIGAAFSLAMSIPTSLSGQAHEVGARLGVAIAIFSPFILASAPLQGALLTSTFHWTRTIVFFASCVHIATAIYFIGAIYLARRKGTWRV